MAGAVLLFIVLTVTIGPISSYRHNQSNSFYLNVVSFVLLIFLETIISLLLCLEVVNFFWSNCFLEKKMVPLPEALIAKMYSLKMICNFSVM